MYVLVSKLANFAYNSIIACLATPTEQLLLTMRPHICRCNKIYGHSPATHKTVHSFRADSLGNSCPCCFMLRNLFNKFRVVAKWAERVCH